MSVVGRISWVMKASVKIKLIFLKTFFISFCQTNFHFSRIHEQSILIKLMWPLPIAFHPSTGTQDMFGTINSMFFQNTLLWCHFIYNNFMYAYLHSELGKYNQFYGSYRTVGIWMRHALTWNWVNHPFNICAEYVAGCNMPIHSDKLIIQRNCYCITKIILMTNCAFHSFITQPHTADNMPINTSQKCR